MTFLVGKMNHSQYPKVRSYHIRVTEPVEKALRELLKLNPVVYQNPTTVFCSGIFRLLELEKVQINAVVEAKSKLFNQIKSRQTRINLGLENQQNLFKE